MNEKEKFVKDFMKLLRNHTGGCGIQHNGCPCRSCFFNLCDTIGLDDITAQKFWDVVLITRGDYTAEQIEAYRREDEKHN